MSRKHGLSYGHGLGWLSQKKEEVVRSSAGNYLHLVAVAKDVTLSLFSALSFLPQYLSRS
jgi:hypothetical protein